MHFHFTSNLYPYYVEIVYLVLRNRNFTSMFGRNNDRDRRDDPPSFLRSILTLAIAGILLFFGYNHYKKVTTGAGGITDVFTPKGGSYEKKEFKIKYKASDFAYEIDDSYTLKLLSDPTNHRKEFNNFLYEYNMALLQHLGKRMGFSPDLMISARDRYNDHHAYIKDLYYKDFMKLRTGANKATDTWYKQDESKAVEAFNEVSSKYTCFMVNHIMTSILETKNGYLEVEGRQISEPCTIALNEGIAPMMKRLKERAIVDDFTRSRGMLSEKVESTISELATMEVRDKKGLRRKLKSKVMGYDVSSTDIDISAISILKAGFDLNAYFDIRIDNQSKDLIVTLPQPKILSHEVYPRVDKLDVGWMRSISDQDFNDNFNLLREQFRKDAVTSDVFKKSKIKVVDVLEILLSPLLTDGYQMKVEFKGSNPEKMLEN